MRAPARRTSNWRSGLSFGLGLLILFGAYAGIDWSFVRTLDFAILLVYWKPLLQGAVITLGLTAASLVAGFVLGGVLAILFQISARPVRLVIQAYVEVFRNTPLIVQLFWIHFGLPSITGHPTSALESGFLALVLQSSAFLTDIARAGIQAVGKGQWEAGRALGLPAPFLWGDVVLPQALKIMIPPFSNLALSFLNGSSLLTVLQVGELMTISAKISDFTFKPIEIMTATALVYLCLNLIISRVAAMLEVATKTPR